MNYQEILVKLQEFYSDDEESQDRDYSNGFDEFAYSEVGDVPGVGKFTEIVQKGGEGEGEEWYSVKHFPDHDVYIKVDGYYASYDGTNFDNEWDGDVSEVRPEQVMVTFYKTVKSKIVKA